MSEHSSSPSSARRRPGWLRRVGLATAVVMGVTAVPVLLPRAAVAEGGPVSGSFAMGGGVNGTVDERKGAFRAAVALVGLEGRGGLDMSVSLTYDQQAAGGARGEGRSGLGAWSYGLPAVLTEGGLRVVPASGGSYEADADEVTGLARYPLEDLKFEKLPQEATLPAREGVDEARAYRYVLRYDDGRTDYFDASGDLTARTDRFGNRADFGWEVSPDGQTHRLAWAADTYGQKTTLEASGNTVTVTSPERSDGKRPKMTLALNDDGQLESVTDAADQVTRFFYEDPEKPALMTRAVSPTGATTVVAYRPVDYVPGLTVVESVKTTDDNGGNTLSERRFSMDVQGGDRRNYTGFPHYQGGDALFDAGDTDAAEYTYMTELSDGKSTVRSTYNKLHLLTKREVKLKTGGDGEGGGVTVQTQELHYAGEQDGRPPRPDDLPANYSKPVEATVTHTDPATGQERTTRETATFDEHGRQTERTDATGAKTVTVFDKRFGLPVKTTVTGTDGAVSISENTLSGDGKTVAGSKTLTGGKDQEPTARTVTSTQTDEHGEVTSTTTGWAEGARPEGDQGPEKTTETREVTVDTAGHTRTDTVTSAAGVTRQVSDLATGKVIESTDAAGRTFSTVYDEAGRAVKQTAPDGLVTTTEYLTPTTTKVTAPDGHSTVESTDLLGRTVKKTDNVRDGKIIPGELAARTLQTVDYSPDGQTATVTDGAGRTSVTTNDALGRTVKTVAPNGMTQLTSYNDAATKDTSTKTTATLPAGETDPAKAVAVTTETTDNAGRPVAFADTYADKTPTTPSLQSFDGLGRVSKTVERDIAITPSYDGPGGTVGKTTYTPENPETYPGGQITAETPRDLTGEPAVKVLTPGGEGGGRAGTAIVRDDAGRITSETRQDGGKYTYTYTPDDRVSESVSPAGVKTVISYEEKTGRISQTAVTSDDGRTTEKTAYSYDPKTGRITEVYNPDDKAGTVISYTYNADGKVLEVAYPDGKTIQQTFDDYHLTSVTDTAGAVTVYSYNEDDGTLQEAVQYDKEPRHSDARELARVAYKYDGLGRVTEVIRGSGDTMTTAYTYTAAGAIKTEKTTRSDGKVVTEGAYAYDSHGNLTHRTDTRPAEGKAGEDGSPVTVTTSTAYRYDAYDRLLGSEVKDADGTLLSATAYTLNVSGDVTSTEITDRDGKKTVTEHTIDPVGRLAAVTSDGEKKEQAWDAEGNLLTDHRGNTYTYNANNQPVSVTAPDGTTTRYAYWADGTRRSTTTGEGANQTTTSFYYDNQRKIVNDTHTFGDPATAATTTTASYLTAATREARTLTGHNAEPAQATGGGYLLHDRHGNTTALTTVGGSLHATWLYTDYGQPADHTGVPATPAAGRPAGPGTNPFTYAGEYTNPETGTQYLKSRTYQPDTGTFITRDTVALFNLYQAFDANPITNVDPSGNSSASDNLVSGILIGIAALTLVLTVIFFPAGGGMSAIMAGVSIAMDLYAMAEEAAAMARGTNHHDFSDPLFITGLAATGVGVLGLGSTLRGIKSSYAHKWANRYLQNKNAADLKGVAKEVGKEAAEFHMNRAQIPTFSTDDLFAAIDRRVNYGTNGAQSAADEFKGWLNYVFDPAMKDVVVDRMTNRAIAGTNVVDLHGQPAKVRNVEYSPIGNTANYMRAEYAIEYTKVFDEVSKKAAVGNLQKALLETSQRVRLAFMEIREVAYQGFVNDMGAGEKLFRVVRDGMPLSSPSTTTQRSAMIKELKALKARLLAGNDT